MKKYLHLPLRLKKAMLDKYSNRQFIKSRSCTRPTWLTSTPVYGLITHKPMKHVQL